MMPALVTVNMSYFMLKNLQPCEIYSVDVKEDWIKDNKEFFASKKLKESVSFGVEDLTQLIIKINLI